jgi:hypothetical protein
MPLGQAPYGSRSPPDPEEGEGPKPPSGPPPGLRISWFLVIPLVALLAYLAAGRGTRGPGHNEDGPTGVHECLTHRSCAADWRCYAVPKDDPFAVPGICAQLCEGDLQCPSQHRCEEVAVGKGQVVPLGARGATAERAHVCRPCDGPCRPQE